MKAQRLSRAEFFAKIARIGNVHKKCRDPKVLAAAAERDGIPIKSVAMTGDPIMEALVVVSFPEECSPVHFIVAFEWAWEHYHRACSRLRNKR
ncbi:MAG TPA: hypothetical protein VJB98_03845 [Candidatus Paceibacterota bacterium]